MANATTVDGHVPNYVDPVTRVPAFLGVQIALTGLALLVVLLRLYTRKFIRHVFNSEDWVTAASMISALVATIVSCLGVYGGAGLHYYDIPPGVDDSIAFRTSFVNQLLYQPTLQLTKVSILLFYMSSLGVGRGVRAACLVLAVLSVLFCIACTVVEFLQCTPFDFIWTGRAPNGRYTCINLSCFFRSTGVINLVLDLATLVLPLPVLWGLNAARRTRVVLCGIFSIGLVALAAEVARLVIWFHTDDGNRENKDSRWNRVTIVNWSCVEYCAGIICASLPHLKALVTELSPAFFDSVPSRAGRAHSLHALKSPHPPGRACGNAHSNIPSCDKRNASRLAYSDY